MALMSHAPALSLVIPVYNEAQSLDELWNEIAQVARDRLYDLEAVFVDDGSRDGSWDRVAQLAARDPRVRGVRFRRNFGKAAALSAGFRAARGRVILTLDADLQDDPRELPRFVEALEKGFDVVSGWKQVRHDPWHKVYPSRVFNAMVSGLTGVRLHDHNCGMKCYRREVVDEVHLYGELHRFVPVLAAGRGWRVGEIVIQHRPRKHGSSKYGVWRFVKGFLDLLTVKLIVGYGQRPAHVFGAAGLLTFGVALLGLAWLTASWVLSRLFTNVEDVHLHTRALFYYSITGLVVGAQFIAIGFLAELINARTHRESDGYGVAERCGEPAAPEPSAPEAGSARPTSTSGGL